MPTEQPGPGRPARTANRTSPRPAWPHPGIVRLCAHPRGQWSRSYTLGGKRITAYFGPLEDPDGALARWRARDRAIREGRDTGSTTSATLPRAVTLGQLAELYLSATRARVGRNGIAPATFCTERGAIATMLRAIDPATPTAELGPSDFAAILEHVRDLSPSTIRHTVHGTRRMFRWAAAEHGFPPPVFGAGFVAPRRLVFRRHARKRAVGVFTAAECRTLLAAATPSLRAVILLALNTGSGSTDLSEIPLSALRRAIGDDSPAGAGRARIVYPRVKTEVLRAAVLWPETVAALEAAGMASKPGPFVTTRTGATIAHVPVGSLWRVDNAGRQFRRLCARTGIPGSLYRLRATFATVADLRGDRDSRKVIMGHARGILDESYVREHGWDRIESTCERVREWLFDLERGEACGPWSGALPPIPNEWRLRPGPRPRPMHHQTDKRWRRVLGLLLEH